MQPPNPKTWTKDHRREATRRILEIAAEVVSETGRDPDKLGELAEMGYSEAEFRRALAELDRRPNRINREVRRLRGLAEGRLVRTTSTRYYVRQPGALDEEFGTPSGARLAASQRLGAVAVTARVVRVGRVAK